MRCTAFLPFLFVAVCLTPSGATLSAADNTPPTDPEAFWAWLTDPETPYAAARAAAYHPSDVLPFEEYLPRVRLEREELRRAWDEHAFGLASPLLASVRAERHRGPVLRAGETITLLGHPYRLPEERIPYPGGDEALGPWPFRVRRIVEIALRLDQPVTLSNRNWMGKISARMAAS